MSSLAAPKVVILTTGGAVNDENFIKLTTFVVLNCKCDIIVSRDHSILRWKLMSYIRLEYAMYQNRYPVLLQCICMILWGQALDAFMRQ